MVKKYEPCYKYYDYEEDPRLEMRQAKDGKFVKLETYKDETSRLNNQVERQKDYIAQLEEKIKMAQELFDFRLKSQPKKHNKKPEVVV